VPPAADIFALAVFAVVWLAYEPILKLLSRGPAINTDMTVLRAAWMRRMAGRENRFIDSQLMGHAINSASFFASSNLILIAAVAGALFSGDSAWSQIERLGFVEAGPRILFEVKLGLVMVTLARGLLAFIWAIRQMNYTLAAIGAAPETAGEGDRKAWGEAAGDLLNPALSSFNAGVRGYYFALAAAAWLLGPWALVIATAGATGLLLWRQRRSRAADAVRRLRSLAERLD